MPEMRMIPAWHITALKAFAVSIGALIVVGAFSGGDTDLITQCMFGPVLFLFPEQIPKGAFSHAAFLCLAGWCCLTAWRLKKFWVYPLCIAWIAAGLALFLDNLSKETGALFIQLPP